MFALVLCACGQVTPIGVVAISPSPTPTPARGFDVVVTERDRDVAALAGQKIEVVLTQRPGMTAWGPIQADDNTILQPVPTGITVARGVTIAGFAAVKAGQATITSTAGPLCSPNQACPQYALLFSVRVSVA